MGGPDGGRWVHHHNVPLDLFPGIRVFHGEFQQLVFIAGDQRLGTHAGLQKLIEQIRGGAFHIPQLLKNILQPGQDLRQIAFVRHAAAEGIGQKPGEHVAGIGFGWIGGAHGNTAVKLGKADFLPGCAGFYGLGQFFHVHRVYAVCNDSKPAVDQGLRHGAAGIQDDGCIEDDLAFHRVSMNLLIQFQSRLIGGE